MTDNEIESYKKQLHSLIDEMEPKFSFDDDIQRLREKFDEEFGESIRKFSDDSTGLSPSRTAIQEVKDRINKLANSKIENCLQEINQHIDWAIEQRNEIEHRTRKKLVIDFLASTTNLFEKSIQNFMFKFNSKELREESIELRRIADQFQQELKKNNEPAKNLFNKEVFSFLNQLKVSDDELQIKVNNLIKNPKFLGLNLNFEFNNSSEKLIATINEIHNSTNNLINKEKELDKSIRDDLELNLDKQLTAINENFKEIQDTYDQSGLVQLIRKMESEKEINHFYEYCRKQIKSLLHDLNVDKNVIGKFSFNESAIKIIKLLIDTELNQAWHKLCIQTKNHDLINESKFESDYINLRLNLDDEIDQFTLQAKKYFDRFDRKKRDAQLKICHASLHQSDQRHKSTISNISFASNVKQTSNFPKDMSHLSKFNTQPFGTHSTIQK